MNETSSVDIQNVRSRLQDTGPGSAKRTAAARVLSLLDAFAQRGEPLTLTEIARRADLSLTTTHRLAHEVLDWGGLEMDEEGRYRLSRKILKLASASTEDLRIRELALPHLVDLQRRTGLTVNLSVREGDEVMYLEALRAHPNYTGQNRMGGRLPLHVTATGQLLLAFADPSFQEDYLSRPLKRYTEFTPSRPEEIRERMAAARRDGFLRIDGALAPGAGSMAAPVPDALGAVDVAVGAIYARVHPEPHGLKDLLLATARRIARARVERPVLDPRTIAFNRSHAGLV
ncbi:MULTISPECIES: IclR family transcriptional regulator [Citricoccus]|uniref:IclR family transcriptional regulator n=1 Tax=Citricoccus TaxID=169133 RepID=UPI00286B6BCA|nr:IclR family transcriptional regulator [Citricoccus sp. I39-566]WMY79664.1 IclR family transcriptional regulator [Citricoccus sp. I39-566]